MGLSFTSNIVCSSDYFLFVYNFNRFWLCWFRFLTKLLTEDLPRLFVRPKKIVLDFQKGKSVGPVPNDFKSGEMQEGNKDSVGELSVTLVDARKLSYVFYGNNCSSFLQICFCNYSKYLFLDRSAKISLILWLYLSTWVFHILWVWFYFYLILPVTWLLNTDITMLLLYHCRSQY